MSFSVTDLKLPADKIAQIEKALGGNPADLTAAKLQGICDEAAADVARLSTGYVLDATSITNFIRAIALYRAYGYIGPVPKDVEKNYDAADKELTEISQGKRPNLPKVSTPAQNTISGGYGSNPNIPGRMS